jgi:hypothetical protein
MVGFQNATLFLIPQFGTVLKPEAARAAEDQYRKYARHVGLRYGPELEPVRPKVAGDRILKKHRGGLSCCIETSSEN